LQNRSDAGHESAPAAGKAMQLQSLESLAGPASGVTAVVTAEPSSPGGFLLLAGPDVSGQPLLRTSSASAHQPRAMDTIVIMPLLVSASIGPVHGDC
jgi:hypothetical protein